MLDILKGDPVENAKKRVEKMHALIVKSIEKQNMLAAAIEDVKKQRVSELVEAALSDTTANTKTQAMIGDAQRQLEEESMVCQELVKRKSLAVDMYFEEKDKARVKKQSSLKAEWDTYQKKLEKMREELKKIGDQSDAVYDQMNACGYAETPFREGYINFNTVLKDPLFPADFKKLTEIYDKAPAQIRSCDGSPTRIVINEFGEITEYQYNL